MSYTCNNTFCDFLIVLYTITIPHNIERFFLSFRFIILFLVQCSTIFVSPEGLEFLPGPARSGAVPGPARVGRVAGRPALAPGWIPKIHGM